jgi:hypothetical protein
MAEGIPKLLYLVGAINLLGVGLLAAFKDFRFLSALIVIDGMMFVGWLLLRK